MWKWKIWTHTEPYRQHFFFPIYTLSRLKFAHECGNSNGIFWGGRFGGYYARYKKKNFDNERHIDTSDATVAYASKSQVYHIENCCQAFFNFTNLIRPMENKAIFRQWFASLEHSYTTEIPSVVQNVKSCLASLLLLLSYSFFNALKSYMHIATNGK